MPHQMYVFGSNGEGQLGIPAAEIVNIPTEATSTLPLEDVTAIRGGDNHTLFLCKDGAVYGVGDNRKGQLGSLGKEPRIQAFQRLYENASFITASCESSAYVTKDEFGQNYIYTEGTGQWGELGHEEQTGPMASTRISTSFPGTIVDFAAGVWHYVAILDNGSVYGWGKARLGQLGNNLTGKVTAPTEIGGIPFQPVKTVCGKDFTYIVGEPSRGEHILLGKDKFNIISNMPENIKCWKDVGATWHAIFVLFDDGTLTAWGKENMWNLLPPNLPRLDKIAVGSDHVLAVTVDGKLISWGWGKHGNCGDLTEIKDDIKNDMISGFWNEIEIPGEIDMIGAGFCTSFAITK
ncbi:RCC1 repeat-containing protein C10F6.04 [Curvularia clavata]|uniref:RCC1 repeat-containing protein C10F6.04 n=1 Tax=Curvularia clavata TaxID=95742 RepID=A0A9Q8Z3S1_CURCL|nr:RCC1 repeat-containing protein C10F6.04 [Curvularia clavata]